MNKRNSSPQSPPQNLKGEDFLSQEQVTETAKKTSDMLDPDSEKSADRRLAAWNSHEILGFPDFCDFRNNFDFFFSSEGPLMIPYYINRTDFIEWKSIDLELAILAGQLETYTTRESRMALEYLQKLYEAYVIMREHGDGTNGSFFE